MGCARSAQDSNRAIEGGSASPDASVGSHPASVKPAAATVDVSRK